MFSSLALSAGLCLASNTTALAQNTSSDSPPAAPPTSDVVKNSTHAGLNHALDNYFAHGYSTHGNSKSIWVTAPTITEVHLLNPKGNGPFKDSYETIEIRPLKWEWLTKASGLSYDATVHAAELQIKNTVWDVRTGVSIDLFQEPGTHSKQLSPRVGGPISDTHQSAFVEAVNGGHILGMPVIGTLGTSLNYYSGREYDRNTFQTFSCELDFPHLAGKSQDTGVKPLDEYAIGEISGMIRAEKSTDGRYNGRIGVYYNRLGSDNTVRFTVGPEVKFDSKDNKVTFGIRSRLSFR